MQLQLHGVHKNSKLPVGDMQKPGGKRFSGHANRPSFNVYRMERVARNRINKNPNILCKDKFDAYGWKIYNKIEWVFYAEGISARRRVSV